MKNVTSLSLLALMFAITACNSSPESKKPLATYYRNCNVMEYSAWAHDFHEIIQVWGAPTDTLYFGKKPPKMTINYGEDDYWHEIAFAWSDTSKVKVEGKETIKLVFDAEIDSLGNYRAAEGRHASNGDCFPLQEREPGSRRNSALFSIWKTPGCSCMPIAFST